MVGLLVYQEIIVFAGVIVCKKGIIQSVGSGGIAIGCSGEDLLSAVSAGAATITVVEKNGFVEIGSLGLVFSLVFAACFFGKGVIFELCPVQCFFAGVGRGIKIDVLNGTDAVVHLAAVVVCFQPVLQIDVCFGLAAVSDVIHHVVALVGLDFFVEELLVVIFVLLVDEFAIVPDAVVLAGEGYGAVGLSVLKELGDECITAQEF